MVYLYVFVALLIGFVAGYFARRGEVAVLSRMRDDVKRDYEKLSESFAELKNESVAKDQAVAKCNAENNSLRELLESERDNSKKLIEEIKTNHSEALKSMRSHFGEIATETMRANAEELRRYNSEQMTGLVTPVREEMAKVQKAIVEVRINGAEQKASVEKAIEGLAQQTMMVGKGAEELANALKDKGKVQGDWGEQLLESILEESGLRKGHEYEIQSNVKDEQGRNLRPDVVVRCPGGKNVVIDSKVSLTGYVNYVGAKSDEELQRYEKENLMSVRRHIDELASKQYDKLVKNTITHVLMFIPNEGSYILALRTDPQLGQYAFRKGVLIINPTNLMMALQLIYNLWQSERQNRNIENIIKQSSELYDKFVTFVETFAKVEDSLKAAHRNYVQAMTQLYEGRGNIVRRLENLKQLGIVPKKEIPERQLGDL